MNISTEPRDDNQVKIVAEFDLETLEKFKRQAARKISKEAKIPGFRPGKAPYDVVRRFFGDEAISKEAIELLIDDQYAAVLHESGVKPSGPGTLEEIISINPPKLAFVVPLVPEVELSDYRSVRQDYSPEPVTEEDIDRVVRSLQSNMSKAEPAERPAENGDLIYLKLSGVIANPAEGEDTEFIKERPRQIIIGENPLQPDDWPYAGFSAELVGMTAGQEKTVSYTFPEDALDERVKGKEVNFRFTVQSVKSMEIPEVNDEFAKKVADAESVDALRGTIRTSLENTRNEEYDRDYITSVVDEIVAQSKIKYPPQMLDEETDHVLHSLEDDLKKQKMDLDTYLKTLEKDEKTFLEEDLKPIAMKRLVRSIAIDKIADDMKIKLSQEELAREASSNIDQITKQRDFALPRGVTMEQMVSAVTYDTAAQLINRRVLNLIKRIGSGQYQEGEEDIEPVVEQTETVEDQTIVDAGQISEPELAESGSVDESGKEISPEE
jgi:trigger factor